MFSPPKDLTHVQKDLYIKDLCYRHYTQSILLPLKIFLFAPQLVQSGEDIVTYTTACSDLVAPLDMFKANCMPTFLVVAAGDIVAFVHGANGKRMKEVVEK